MSNNPISFSPLVIGAMRLGSWGVNMSFKELEMFVDGCLELGISDFDHADIYGHYTEESNFGKLLNKRKDLKSRIEITTKCGIKIKADNRPDHTIKSYDASYDHIIKSAEQSLLNLDVDCIKLLLIHRPDYLLNPEEVAEAFDRLRQAGKVEFFGVSNFSTSQFDLLNSFIPLTNHQIEVSITHLDPFGNGQLDQCLKNGVVPTAWSPLGGGQLFGAPNDEKTQKIQSVIQRLGEKYDTQPDELLYAWLAKHPAGIVPVTGTSKISRIKNALKGVQLEISHEDWYRLTEASLGQEVP